MMRVSVRMMSMLRSPDAGSTCVAKHRTTVLRALNSTSPMRIFRPIQSNSCHGVQPSMAMLERKAQFGDVGHSGGFG